MLMERNTLMEWVYPKIKEYCREKHGLEFQVKINEAFYFLFTHIYIFLISTSLHFTLVTSKIICKLNIYSKKNETVVIFFF